MLVEVQGVNGPVRFLNDSAWRNMLIGTASRFEHEAEISLVGLAPGLPRDIYLSVKTQNRPAKVSTDPASISPNQGSTKPDIKQNPLLRYKLVALLLAERMIVQGQPVCEVRGYRNTGKGTSPVQLLSPMVPYGYIINHSGALVGWKHALTGLNTTVTELIPGTLYKV